MFQNLSREDYNKLKIERGNTEGCPFCGIESKKGEKIVRKGKHWILVHNISSYSGDHRHIMAIPLEHIVFTYDLNPDQMLELQTVYQEAKNFFGDENYFSFTRETMNAARSVEHMHIHFLVGRLKEGYLMKMLENQGYPIKQTLDIDK